MPTKTRGSEREDTFVSLWYLSLSLCLIPCRVIVTRDRIRVVLGSYPTETIPEVNKLGRDGEVGLTDRLLYVVPCYLSYDLTLALPSRKLLTSISTKVKNISHKDIETMEGRNDSGETFSSRVNILLYFLESGTEGVSR